MTTRQSVRVLVLALAIACTSAAAPSTQTASLFAVRFQPGAAWDKSKPPAGQAGFASHSANLQRLRREGRVVLGGRFGDLGLIVLSASDAAAARELFATDETIAARVFTIQIDPWSTIFDGCLRQ
jgi:uncharacterized protein YciI